MRRNRESVESYSHSRGPSFFNGLVIGMMAGAAAYFLFGTKKGEKVRKDLGKQAKRGWKEVGEVAEKAEKTGKKISKDVKKLKTKVEKQAQKKQAQAVKELGKLQTKVEKARQKADQMQESLKQTAAKIENRFFTKNGQSLKK